MYDYVSIKYSYISFSIELENEKVYTQSFASISIYTNEIFGRSSKGKKNLLTELLGFS